MRHRFVCILLVLLYLLPSCAGEKSTPDPVVRPVVTTVVEAPGRTRELSFSGVARSAIETVLSFRVGGEIISLPPKIGSRIQPGDLIAQLDKTDYELQVKQLEAQLAQAKAQSKGAKSDYDRDRSLYESGSISKKVLDGSRAKFESADAQVQATQKGLDLANQQVSYTSLKAPVSGTIASLPVEVHQTVNPGQAVATLTSDGTMQLELGVPDRFISSLRVNDPATVTFEALAGVSFPATISELGTRQSESTTYPVKLRLLEQDERMKSGMVGEATFTLEIPEEEEFILVPLTAVAGREGGKRFVWVVDSSTNTVSRRSVSTGGLTSKGIQIQSGLQQGEVIVIRGINRLTEGQKVRLLD